jgi:hypothetical protein
MRRPRLQGAASMGWSCGWACIVTCVSEYCITRHMDRSRAYFVNTACLGFARWTDDDPELANALWGEEPGYEQALAV